MDRALLSSRKPLLSSFSCGGWSGVYEIVKQFHGAPLPIALTFGEIKLLSQVDPAGEIHFCENLDMRYIRRWTLQGKETFARTSICFARGGWWNHLLAKCSAARMKCCRDAARIELGKMPTGKSFGLRRLILLGHCWTALIKCCSVAAHRGPRRNRAWACGRAFRGGEAAFVEKERYLARCGVQVRRQDQDEDGVDTGAGWSKLFLAVMFFKWLTASLTV